MSTDTSGAQGAIAGLTNHQIRLASRPTGLPTRANWQFTEEPVQAPGPGGVLVKTLYLSLDPAMRGWMNEGTCNSHEHGVAGVVLYPAALILLY